MIIEKVSNIPELNKDYKDQDIVKILDEGELKETRYGNKMILGIKFEGDVEKRMMINDTSRNNLIDAYGEDTKGWVGKETRIHVVKQMVGKEMKNVTYLTHPAKNMEGEPIA